MKVTAKDLTLYFRLHKMSTTFDVHEVSDEEGGDVNEVAIMISKEDFERYMKDVSKATCFVCGEPSRPYTKGELIDIEGGRPVHVKCGRSY
jgi:hypothetical protein